MSFLRDVRHSGDEAAAVGLKSEAVRFEHTHQSWQTTKYSTFVNATSTEGGNQREKQQASTAEPATGATTARQEIGAGEAAAASAGGGSRDAAAGGAGATRQPAAATLTNRAMAATTTDSLGPATGSI